MTFNPKLVAERQRWKDVSFLLGSHPEHAFVITHLQAAGLVAVVAPDDSLTRNTTQ